MDIQPQLKQLGLNNSEITVYLFLLQNGVSTPPAVSRGTRIARTNCYNILNRLKDQNLIKEQESGKRKSYLASDPESLVRTLELKKEAIQQILPDLRALYTTQKNKPKIQYFEGKEQISQIYDMSLEAQKVVGIGSTKHLSTILPGEYTRYLKEIKRRGIVFYDILTSPSIEKGAPEMIKTLGGLYDVHYLESKYEDLPTDILIWNDSVALITLEEPIFGTVITNKLIAKSMMLVFDVMWSATQ
jgi:HTH-type transcriptional regulator, sugar sensing transcriptional regulator